MKHVDDHVLAALKQHVEQLPARRKLRPYDVVAELAELYARASARGYDLDDLVRVLDRHGIKLTRTTVRNYLSRARASHRNRAEPITPSLQATVLALPTRVHAEPAPATATISTPATPPASPPIVINESVPGAAAMRDPPAPATSTPVAHEARPSTESSPRTLPRGHFQPKPDSKDI